MEIMVNIVVLLSHRVSIVFNVGSLTLLATVTNAEQALLLGPATVFPLPKGAPLVVRANSSPVYDPAPVPYCNISFDTTEQYTEMEDEVTSANPAGKTLAQFVLEAFAQANANNGLLDSVSQSDVVTALTKLQAMWVPSALNFKTNYTDTGLTDTNQVAFVTEQLIQVPYPFSVGSAQTAYFDDTFEGLTIMLPGNGNTTNVNFDMQGRGDYYLQELAADGKSDTLEPYIAAVQNGAETLFFATSGAVQDASASSVASTIVIPSSAQIWLGTAQR